MPLRLICMLLAIAALAGCSTRKYYPLTEQKFDSTPDGQEVKLFVNEVQRPHIKIAHVESFSDRERDPETVRKQLEDLKRRSRDLGADAVVNVREYRNQVRGFVVDERVPFRAYRQGRFELYMLRGTAIRYVETPEEAAAANTTLTTEPPPATGVGTGAIPIIETPDTRDNAPMETVPRGLEPRIP